jgi:putative hydrolase of the HAD superfamily
VRRCLLIDLDDVLRVWAPERDASVERRHGMPPGSIAEAAFGEASSVRSVITGRITDAQWRADIAVRLAPLCGASAHAAVDEWSKSTGAVDPAVLEVVRTLRRRGWRVGLLTNATSRLDSDLASLGLRQELDAVINSSDLGVAKPDPEVFRLACRVMDASPEDCVFVDDRWENVSAAREVGMVAHLFEGAGALAAALETWAGQAVAAASARPAVRPEKMQPPRKVPSSER